MFAPNSVPSKHLLKREDVNNVSLAPPDLTTLAKGDSPDIVEVSRSLRDWALD